jgi:hypothetical protein
MTYAAHELAFRQADDVTGASIGGRLGGGRSCACNEEKGWKEAEAVEETHIDQAGSDFNLSFGQA